MDYNDHICYGWNRNRETNTLADLIKARDALNAKIAALKKAELAKAIKGVVHNEPAKR
jgi:hypothetical protein